MGLAMVAAGLALVPVAALAQTAPATTNTPATDAVGPRELQNFSLNGTVTKPADGAATTATPRPRTAATAPSADRAVAAAPRETAAEPRRTAPARVAVATPPPQTRQPSLDFPSPATATPASVPEPGFSPEADSAPSTLAPESKLLLWPWLLLAAMLGAGGAFLLWRRRSHAVLADGPEFHAYVAPEPTPPPRPAPAPAPAPEAAPPKPVGLVSSRLRPWIDVAFAPLGCVVEDERVTIEFEVQLTNTGGAPAREVLVEASMFNAGATQEQDIGAFFARPQGEGERIEGIPPLQNVTIRTSLVAPRQNIQLFELGGHQVFVPLIAFNVLYRLANGSAQTSLAYMLGRDTKGEKLGPFRADLGPKAFTKLGTLPLPMGIRN